MKHTYVFGDQLNQNSITTASYLDTFQVQHRTFEEEEKIQRALMKTLCFVLKNNTPQARPNPATESTQSPTNLFLDSMTSILCHKTAISYCKQLYGSLASYHKGCQQLHATRGAIVSIVVDLLLLETCAG